MMGLGDFDNTFAGFTENGTVAPMDVESGVVYGSCLHGMAIQNLGTSVLFVDRCAPCERTLALEGYVVIGVPVVLAA